jgi:hypothetical protein
MRMFFWKERFSSDDVFAFAIKIDKYEPTQGILGTVSPRTLATPLSRATYERFLNAKSITLRIQFSNLGLQDYKFNAVKAAEALKYVLNGCPAEGVPEADLVPFDPAKGLQTPEEARAYLRAYRDRKNNEEINVRAGRS